MTAFLYVYDRKSGKWCVRDVLDTEVQARAEARLLWKAGAAGIRIDVTRTVVEELRPTQWLLQTEHTQYIDTVPRLWYRAL